MTPIPEEAPGRSSVPNGSRSGDGFWVWLRDLGVQRRTEHRWFAGVCSGLADRFGVDPVLVRAAFLLVLLFGGFGVPLYLAAWAFLPDRHGEIAAENAVRHRDVKSIVLLVVVGITVLGGLSNKWWLWLILAPIGIFLFWVLTSARSGKSSDEIGRETSELATRLGDSVSRWASAQGAAARATEASQRASTAPRGPTTEPYAASTAPAVPVTLEKAAAPAAWPGVSAPGASAYGASAHGASPYGMGPGRTGPVAASPPRIVRDRRRRGGFLGFLLVAGLAVAGYASGTQLQSRFAWPTSTPETFALACALGGVGLALFLVGLTGRRAGFLTFLATVVAIAAVTGTMGQGPEFTKGGVGERTWKVSDAVPADGYHLGAGQATLDLTGATMGQDLTVRQGLGDLTILVPTGVTATIDASVTAGKLIILRSDGSRSQDDKVDSVTQKFGAGPTTVHLTAQLGAGDLTIKEQPR